MVITLITLFCTQFFLANVKATSSSSPFSILFDEAHDQYYTYSNTRFKTALSYLNQTNDCKVYLNKAEFENLTKMLYYDLIIIGNPGPDGNFSITEIDLLKNYTELGGNLILLCNYNDVSVPVPDENITGHADYLNNITQALSIPALFTQYDLHHNGTDHTPIGKREVVEIAKTNFKLFHPIKYKLKNILTFTSGLNVTQESGIISTGYSNSYLEYNESIIYSTPWLFAIQQGSARIVLCGSTVMFSDLNVTDTGSYDYTGVHWIDSVDNLRLWLNLIHWTLTIEIPNLSIIFILIISLIAIIGIIVLIYYTRYAIPKTPSYEIEKQNLEDERAMVLKEARSRAAEGMYLAAAQLYKRAAKLSNKLNDSEAEVLYNNSYRKFLTKSKK